MSKTLDFDIRAHVVSDLLNRGIPRGDIRHELTLDTSSSGGRADVVVLRDDRISTIEIKSGSDRLTRLSEQMKRFARAFDYTALVFDKKHYPAAEKHGVRYDLLRGAAYCGETRGYVDWVSVPGGGGVVSWVPIRGIAPLLRPRYHRYHSSSSVADMARLMWRNEAVAVAGRLGHGGSGTREYAIDWLRENASLKETRPLIVDQLRQRTLNNWEVEFWKRFDALQLEAA